VKEAPEAKLADQATTGRSGASPLHLPFASALQFVRERRRDGLDGRVRVEAVAGEQRIGPLAASPRIRNPREGVRMAFQDPPRGRGVSIRLVECPILEDIVGELPVDPLPSQL
jgi:hypothetical protein